MDPTIVGLTADADAAAVESQARALIAFRDQVCSALGCGSAAEAVGKVTAAAEALAERDALRSALAAAEQSARADRLRSALTAAVDEKRLTLGELARVVPSLYGAGRAAAVEAVGKVEKQEASALVGALVGVPLSAEAVDSVTAYIDAKAPASLPSPVGAPAIPAGAAEAVAAELDKTTDTIRKAGAAARAALGLNPA
jgi:hypothetical protein